MGRLKLILAILPFFAFMSWAYYQRIGAFGCFDDCSHLTVGYFMTKGRTIYSEIFSNHNMLIAYISYAIQSILDPSTIYHLILYHRLFVLLVSSVLGVLLILRFGWPAFGFTLFYESTKYYMFGDRFLAEGIIVYPLVYLFCLFWLKAQKEKIFKCEYIISGIFTWFVIFMREPYIPLALALYVAILWKKRIREIYLSIFTFLLLSLLTLASLPLPDYIFNVFEVNLGTTIAREAQTNQLLDIGILKIIAYPLYILFYGEETFLRTILITLSIVFLILLGLLILKLKKIKEAFGVILLLGLANIRYVNPGSMFYEAFHMIPWYGMFIMATFLMLQYFYKHSKKIPIVLITTLAILFGFIILSPQAFFREKVDRSLELDTGYSRYFSYGNAIKILSNPNDTLFVDGFDELISQQANLNSPYKYSLYTSVMPLFTKYTDERERMLRETPPDFYYGDCKAEHDPSGVLPEKQKGNYVRFYFSGKPTCLHVRKAKLKEIKEKQLDEVKTNFGFDILN